MCDHYITATGSAGATCLVLTDNIAPVNVQGFGGTFTNFTLWAYLANSFMGWRGSIRARFFPAMSSVHAADYGLGTKVCLLPPSSIDVTPSWIKNSSSVFMPSFEGGAYFALRTNCGLEYELPFMSPNLFHFAFDQSAYIEDGTNNVMEPSFVRSYSVTLYYTNNSAANLFNSPVDYSMGEDFNFFRFQGAPYYTLA